VRIKFHPKLADDVRRFSEQYRSISPGLEHRFRQEILAAIEKIKTGPTSAGHYLNTGSAVIKEFRRRNLASFPFFLLYGLHEEELIFGALIPSRSDPLTWLMRFSDAHR
jgi:hypothetical protein